MKPLRGCLVAVAFAPLLGVYFMFTSDPRGEMVSLGIFVFLCALPAAALLVLVRKRPMNPALAVNILTASGLLVTGFFYLQDFAWRPGYVEFSQGNWDIVDYLTLVEIFPLWCVVALVINVALYLSKHPGVTKLTRALGGLLVHWGVVELSAEERQALRERVQAAQGAGLQDVLLASLMLGIVVLTTAGVIAFSSSCVVTHSVPDGSDDTCAIALHPGVVLPTPTPP